MASTPQMSDAFFFTSLNGLMRLRDSAKAQTLMTQSLRVFHFSILVCGAAILGIAYVIKVLECQLLDPQKKTLADMG